MSEKSEKIKKFFRHESKNLPGLDRLIEEACDGLIYVSETDAPVTAFDGGVIKGDVGSKIILQQTGSDPNETIRELDIAKFFERLITVQEWHGTREKEMAKKFLDLQKLIEENLRGPKVFKIGDIRIRIYAVGIDGEGRIIGIMTNAVET